MELLGGLLHGFAVALTPANIMWCFVGCFLGTLIGVLTIAVVQTAMNLLAIGTHWQNVTLGLIVLLVYSA